MNYPFILTKGNYEFYKDGTSSGNLENYIYKDGKYTNGTLVTDDISVTSKVTAKK